LDRLNSLEPDSLESAWIEHAVVRHDSGERGSGNELQIFLSDVSLTQTLGRTEKRSALL
jgi:hypothetical protein